MKNKIYSTQDILKELDHCIEDQLPFSTVRYGDAIFGMIAALLLPGLIDEGKWKGESGEKVANSIMGQLTIPPEKRDIIMKQVIEAAQNANYCDSFDAYYLLGKQTSVGIIGQKCQEIHRGVDITNSNYCNPYLHYFSVVQGEYNLFSLMRGRRVFCISNQIQIVPKLKNLSGAKDIDYYKIPRRGRQGKHYLNHYKKIIKLILHNAKDYDLFLIGAGLLGKIYCDKVKEYGGRAFDSGRLFDLWSGQRKIDSRPKRFIEMDTNTMLCRRLRTHPSGVW